MVKRWSVVSGDVAASMDVESPATSLPAVPLAEAFRVFPTPVTRLTDAAGRHPQFFHW